MKVYKRFYDSENPDSIYPEIKITGLWLKRFGFIPHAKYNLLAEEGRIILTLNKAKSPKAD